MNTSLIYIMGLVIFAGGIVTGIALTLIDERKRERKPTVLNFHNPALEAWLRDPKITVRHKSVKSVKGKGIEAMVPTHKKYETVPNGKLNYPKQWSET